MNRNDSIARLANLSDRVEVDPGMKHEIEALRAEVKRLTQYAEYLEDRIDEKD